MILQLVSLAAQNLGLDFIHGTRAHFEHDLQHKQYPKPVCAMLTPPSSSTALDKYSLLPTYTEYDVRGYLFARATDPTDPAEVERLAAELRTKGIALYVQCLHSSPAKLSQEFRLTSGISLEDALPDGLPSSKHVGLSFSFAIRLKPNFDCELLGCPPLTLNYDC